ncbi:MAG: glycosyltransferase family 4 protein, partial [Caldilineaceae bacterium]
HPAHQTIDLTPQLRVLHLVHQYPPEHLGGTELYTQTVARALSARSHPVSVFTRRNAHGAGRAETLDADVAVHLAWNGALSPTQRFLTTFGNADLERNFDSVLADFRPDLVHIQHLMGLPTSLLHSIRRRGIPYIVTLHDFWWVCANAQLVTNYSGEICNGPNLWLNCARCALARGQQNALWPAIPALAVMLARRGGGLRRVLEDAACLIAPSRFVKDWYAEHGIAAGHIRVLSHGIDAPPHTREDNTDHPRRFLYAGGLAWQKGVHIAVEALAGVRGDSSLWIAGDETFDPAYSARLRALAANAPAGQVRFLGRLSRAQLWQTLAQVDAVVVPSLWYETFSLIVHEAFAAGVPVVVSNLGALAEAVRHQIDGLRVEPGDVDAWRKTLQRLVDDPTLATTLAAQIRPPMTLDDHITQLQQIYRQAVAAHDQ